MKHKHTLQSGSFSDGSAGLTSEDQDVSAHSVQLHWQLHQDPISATTSHFEPQRCCLYIMQQALAALVILHCHTRADR